MSRILVTGGAGLLGSHLCERLLKDDHEVVCVDNFYSSSKKNIADLFNNKRFELIRHDITFPLYIEVDEIYNLACPASPIHYQRDPVQTVKTSVHGSINMLGLAKRTGAKILLASTSEVYGDPIVHPQPESYLGNVNTVGDRSCYSDDTEILTESGWTTANRLKNGNNLFRVYSGIINSSLVKTESNNSPSERFKKRGFLHVLSLLSSRGMPATAVNFNGKLFVYESKVNVVLPNGKIRARANAKLLERIMQGKLIFTGAESRSSNGTLDEFFIGSFTTTDSIVCGGYISLKTVLIPPSNGLAKVQLIESNSGKVSINTDSTNPEDFRYLVNREIFISEESCEPFGVNVDFSTHNSAIVHVSKRLVNDIVYNMSVENTNTYIANGFVSHNCACLINPVLKDRDEFMAELQAYVNGDDNAIADWASVYGI